MQVDILDNLKPNVFLIRASEGQQMGYMLYINLGLGCKIGTFLGHFLHVGPIWEQVPNWDLIGAPACFVQ